MLIAKIFKQIDMASNIPADFNSPFIVLHILSGFYELLKPFNAVTPYRLEMQAKLSVNGNQDLDDFLSLYLDNSSVENKAKRNSGQNGQRLDSTIYG